jgi:hypothetical protein
MFEVSNTIAYNGLMVFGTPTDRKPFHGENAWIDVRSSIQCRSAQVDLGRNGADPCLSCHHRLS